MRIKCSYSEMRDVEECLEEAIRFFRWEPGGQPVVYAVCATHLALDIWAETQQCISKEEFIMREIMES